MNRLSLDRRAAVLACLVDGASIRATVRMTGAAKNTVVGLLKAVGAGCQQFQDETLTALPCERIQADEIWAFIGCKDKTVPLVKKRTRDSADHLGDVWTWTALDPDTKLMAAWLVGERSKEDAHAFIKLLAGRLSRRIQLTTDGLTHYVTAVEETFGWGKCDFAQIVKEYGCYVETERGERRYSPSTCTGFYINPIMGKPDPEHISTSLVERSNLTLRMQQRRFTRLTNAFSRRVANLRDAVALHMMFYNFVRPHMTLNEKHGGIRTTPAMEAGLASRPWTLAEVAELADRHTPELDEPEMGEPALDLAA